MGGGLEALVKSFSIPQDEIANGCIARYRLPDGKANPHEYEPDHTKSPAVDARLDRIPGCETTVNGRKWLAFPPMMWKSYDGGRPGPDRVIASATRSASGAYENSHYCLSTYHAGNYYAPCT